MYATDLIVLANLISQIPIAGQRHSLSRLNALAEIRVHRGYESASGGDQELPCELLCPYMAAIWFLMDATGSVNPDFTLSPLQGNTLVE